MLGADAAAELIEQLQPVQVVLGSHYPAGLGEGPKSVGIDGDDNTGGDGEHIRPLRPKGEAQTPDAVLHPAHLAAALEHVLTDLQHLVEVLVGLPGGLQPGQLLELLRRKVVKVLFHGNSSPCQLC